MAEAQVPVLLDEEIAKALPHVRRGRLRRERSIDEILREAGPNDRSTAKNAAVGRGELVDPRRHQALDRVRQLGDAARLPRDRHQLGQEERVPARPLGQRLDLVRQKGAPPSQRGLVRRPELRRAAGARSRRRLHPRGRRSLSAGRARATTTSHGRCSSPLISSRRRSAEASSIQCVSSKTSRVASSRSIPSSSRITSSSRALRNSSASGAVSGVSGSSRPNGTPMSGSHGVSWGALTSTRSRKRRSMVSGSSLVRTTDELTEQVAEGEVRSRRLVLLALHRAHGHPLGGSAKLLDQP